MNTQFTRSLLKTIHAAVGLCFPGTKPMKAATVTGDRKSQWFVQIHVPGFPPLDDFYKAYDAYEARAKAWTRFLDKHAPDQIKSLLHTEELV